MVEWVSVKDRNKIKSILCNIVGNLNTFIAVFIRILRRILINLLLLIKVVLRKTGYFLLLLGRILAPLFVYLILRINPWVLKFISYMMFVFSKICDYLRRRLNFKPVLLEEEERLFRTLSEGKKVLCLIKTGTKVDVGLWFRRRKVWLFLTPDEIVIFTAGRWNFVERIKFDQLNETVYNHITGEIILAPYEGEVNSLKVDPLSGYYIAEKIRGRAIGVSIAELLGDLKCVIL